MKDVDKLLRDLSGAARSEPPRPIDVRAHVLDTLTSCPRPGPLEIVPVVFAGVALTVSVAVLLVVLPSWQTLTDPWVAYMP